MTDFALILRIVIRWFLVALACSAIVCLFWSFAGAFAQKKSVRIALVGILMFISIGAYVLNHRTPKVVHMKEDTLYIKPNNN